jgi:hypothetical protein
VHTALPDCPAAPAEVCGDCIDNDGDGLTDYEDPDCCAQPMALSVRRLVLKPEPTKTHGNRLRLKARYASFVSKFFDPSRQDTSIQIADQSGQVFCATIPAEHWTHRRYRTFRFRDKRGAFARGLKMGRFRMKANGEVLFQTRGKKVNVRAMTGGRVDLTVRVGEQCAQSTTELRTKPTGLVYP